MSSSEQTSGGEKCNHCFKRAKKHTVCGDQCFVGNVVVKKDLLTEGDSVTNGKNTAKNQCVLQDSTVNGKSTVGNLCVQQDSVVNGNSAVSGSSTVSQNMTVSGDSTVGGDSTISGNSTVNQNSTVNGLSTVNRLCVTDEAKVNGQLAVQGPASVFGDALFNQTLTVTENLVVGGSILPHRYVRVGFNAASQNINNDTFTVVQWPAVLAASGLTFNVADSKFVVPQTGIYSFKTFLVYANGFQQDGVRSVGILIDNQVSHISHHPSVPRASSGATDSATLFLQAGQEVESNTYQSSGVALPAGGVSSFLEIIQLR